MFFLFCRIGVLASVVGFHSKAQDPIACVPSCVHACARRAA